MSAANSFECLQQLTVNQATNGEPLNLDPRYRSAVRCAADFFSQSAVDSWWLQELFNNGNATFESVENSIDAITTAITNKIRTFGSDWDGSQALATGTSTRTTICTQVRKDRARDYVLSNESTG